MLLIYSATAKFLNRETYSLVDQMRRAAISVSSNIAEGFSRYSYKEKIQFYFMAQGSLTELENHLIIARDVSYLSPREFAELSKQCIYVHRLISGLIKGARKKF